MAIPRPKGCVFELVSGAIMGEDVVFSPPPVSLAGASADKIRLTVGIYASFILPNSKTVVRALAYVNHAVI